ncbi:hypothetical protein XAC3562_1200058 [Xanthomonas citri pv. citri]|uniref:Uncharacterized protein n=1 Tax=Xanthomonas citri pv. citri TaxID=611301 RepID=A0A0U5FCS0_XANCI|nr:hypothetical protein XAC3562_1200058 [Xanthomonas citri pv. citri]
MPGHVGRVRRQLHARQGVENGRLQCAVNLAAHRILAGVVRQEHAVRHRRYVPEPHPGTVVADSAAGQLDPEMRVNRPSGRHGHGKGADAEAVLDAFAAQQGGNGAGEAVALQREQVQRLELCGDAVHQGPATTAPCCHHSTSRRLQPGAGCPRQGP